jgi:hypothetical protein
MRSGSGLIAAVLLSGIAFPALPAHLFSQQPDTALVASVELPEAPRPQVSTAAAEPAGPEAQGGQSQSEQPTAPSSTPAQSPAPEGSSSSQAPAGQPAAATSQHEKADEQIKEQEHQRVLGIVPAFNTSYRSDAVSLTARQKLSLAFHSTTDPFAFGAAFLVAGYHEANDDNTGFGWGIEGYGKRSGAAYLDAFDGNMIGNGILPALLHQDPRYFRLGHGTVSHRLLYAAATTFICKHDNTGRWEPNYSNVAGNIISGALSNYYYPSSDSGAGQTISNGMIVTVEGAFGSVFQEFWPDISRKFLHKDPTNGLDAQARVADEARREAGKSAR